MKYLTDNELFNVFLLCTIIGEFLLPCLLERYVCIFLLSIRLFIIFCPNYCSEVTDEKRVIIRQCEMLK